MSELMELMERARQEYADRRPVSLSLKDGEKETPEVRAWLDEVELKIKKEYDRRMTNLMVYGTTHPELARKDLEK